LKRKESYFTKTKKSKIKRPKPKINCLPPLTKTIITIIFAWRSLAPETYFKGGFKEEFSKDLATCCSVVSFTKSMNTRPIYSA